MSQTAAEMLPIGAVQAYLNGIRLGTPRSQATLRYSVETVMQRLGDNPAPVSSYKSTEIAEVDIVIADLTIAQLRNVYDAAASFSARTTHNTQNYKTGTSTIFFYKEDVTLSGTAAVALGQAGIAVTSTIKVYRQDMYEYTKGTDWTVTSYASGQIKRKGGSTMPTPSTVIVHYQQSGTADVVHAGGSVPQLEMTLELEHILDDGKMLKLFAHRVRRIGASDIAIQMAAEFGGIPMSFRCLADMTKAPGRQLFYWAKSAT